MRRRLTAPVARIASAVRHSKAAMALGLVFMVGLVGVLATSGGTPASASTAPTPGPSLQYAATWTLADLVRHADAGEILMIATADAPIANGSLTLAPGKAAAATAPVLAAKTTDLQWVQVQLSQTQGQAIAALRALGYGRLMSQTADSEYATGGTVAAGSAGGAAPASSGGFSSFFGLLLIVGTMGLSMLLLARVGTRAGGWSPTSSSSAADQAFTTLYPEGAEPPGAKRDTVVRAKAVLFDEVAGVEEAKLELAEVVDFLRDPERFTRLGATIPRGVLLYGGPGTGKTLLAKAVASEAGVPFTFAAGSDFVERFVGVGASRVRALFKQARAAGKGVIFIDEIDALAKARASGPEGGHREADQTLNALLAEMDGFTTTDEVIVLAATNRLDVLDPAVLRPGRFTRKVSVPNPDREAREAILAVHARGKPLAADVDLGELARKTGEFSGAMLADLLNEAAILAARRSHEEISLADVDDAWVKVAIGVGRRRSMPLRERTIIAAHEAGHAVCGQVWAPSRTVTRISMYRHGDALGYTVSHADDELLPDEAAMRGQLVALLGGRAAEALLFQQITGGASNDFEKATELAMSMATRLGIGADPHSPEPGVTGRGRLGYLVETSSIRLHGDLRAAAQRAAVALLDEAYETALSTLREHLDAVERVAAFLVAEEEMTGEQFAAVWEGRLSPSPSALRDWRHADAKPRKREEVTTGAGPAPRPVPVAAAAAGPDQRGGSGAGARRLAGAGLRALASAVHRRHRRDSEEDA